MSRHLHMNRRETMKWTAAVASILAMGGVTGCRNSYVKGSEPKGYGKDPRLVDPETGHWPSLLESQDRALLTAVIDTILPATDTQPSASEVGVVEFFEEWLSAPYPDFVSDRELILPELRRLPSAAEARSWVAVRQGDAALARMRILTAAAYYTKPLGHTAIGFVGNEPLPEFKGPPPEVLDHLEREFAKL